MENKHILDVFYTDVLRTWHQDNKSLSRSCTKIQEIQLCNKVTAQGYFIYTP